MTTKGGIIVQIEPVVFENKSIAKKKNVCAYARVSMNDDGMLHSLNNQILFYKEEILSHPDWNFVGVFHDKPTTGTKEDRPEFSKMLKLCEEGKIDMIITKTISRFARNTVTTLKWSRELRQRGIDIYFESENIHTISSNGELFLSLYAAIAQAESLSVSENCKWRIKKAFQEGILTPIKILGYNFENGSLKVNEKEALIVKEIFNLYLDGKGTNYIANELNQRGIKTKLGCEFTPKAIHVILINEKYCGNALLQKWYSKDHLTKEKVANNGEKDAYFVEESHQAIIDKETFEKVQIEMSKRAMKYAHECKCREYPFTKKIKCGICGKSYRRKIVHGKPVLICTTYDRKGKSMCPSKRIPEEILMKVSANILGIDEFDTDIFNDMVSFITVYNSNRLIFRFEDGTEQETYWKDKSRSESWTDEMREKARERQYAKCSNN